MNKLIEFSNSAFDVFESVDSVVEDVLGNLGRLHRSDWIVDATVEDPRKSTMYALVEKFGMNIAGAAGVSTGVNECIERSGANGETIACVIAYNPCTVCPPVLVLKDATNLPDEYVKIYSARSGHAVLIRRDLARRVGATSMEIISKKNTTSIQ